MDPLAISRRLLLQRIAPEEPAANTYNEEEVMLLLSEIYNDRLTSSEIDLLKIKPLKKTFRCKFCKSKFKPIFLVSTNRNHLYFTVFFEKYDLTKFQSIVLSDSLM